jgi:hypothetical protein
VPELAIRASRAIEKGGQRGECRQLRALVSGGALVEGRQRGEEEEERLFAQGPVSKSSQD